MLKMIAFISWLTVGITVLAVYKKEVPRILYFLCWITLMLNLIIRVMVEGV